ncbi:hypothetical protein LCGC14_3092110 [marine sediment metagenome]|uniref:Uncharacterized protein n=1 Tax=marine sediment metagenome TaxID=412755 RepID=A0A0F8YHL7_9ZZZZ
MTVLLLLVGGALLLYSLLISFTPAVFIAAWIVLVGAAVCDRLAVIARLLTTKGTTEA